MNKTLRVTGVLMMADSPGISKRIYPREVLEKAAEILNNVPMSINWGETKDGVPGPVIGFTESARVEGDALICDGIITKADLEKVWSGDLFFTPAGVGTYDPLSKVVEAKSYSISYVAMSPINGWEDQEPCKLEDSEEKD